MIQQLQGHITDAQINTISTTICTQYRNYLRLTGSQEFNRVFANEYAPHNRQHSISWAISSAFQSNTVVCDNFQISRLAYGCGHVRPLISNDAIELMVLILMLIICKHGINIIQTNLQMKNYLHTLDLALNTGN